MAFHAGKEEVCRKGVRVFCDGDDMECNLLTLLTRLRRQTMRVGEHGRRGINC